MEIKSGFNHVHNIDMRVNLNLYSGVKFHLKSCKTQFYEIETLYARNETCTWLTIKKGYAFDGTTGKPDTKKDIEAAAVHDALYQALRDGNLNFDFYPIADKIYMNMCIKAGTWRPFAKCYHAILKLLKGKYAKAKNERKVWVVNRCG